MTLELWNTFATFGTFVVIAATAIAAIVQLRHARSSNQIAAMAELQDAQQTSQFITARRFVITELASKLKDPEFRYQVANSAARADETQAVMSQAAIVADYYEGLGLLVKTGLLDRDLALNMWSGDAPGAWDRLAPIFAIFRRRQGQVAWENFEYLAVLAQDWIAAHPKGAYPAGTRRIGLKDEWLEADVRYAASRVSA